MLPVPGGYPVLVFRPGGLLIPVSWIFLGGGSRAPAAVAGTRDESTVTARDTPSWRGELCGEPDSWSGRGPGGIGRQGCQGRAGRAGGQGRAGRAGCHQGGADNHHLRGAGS